MSSRYLATKLRESHVLRNVTEKKKPILLRSVLSATPKLLRTGFSELNPASSTKKKDVPPTSSTDKQPTTRSASKKSAAPSPTIPIAGPNPFTPAVKPKRGRKRKPPANAASTASKTAAVPTPSPPVGTGVLTRAGKKKPAKETATTPAEPTPSPSVATEASTKKRSRKKKKTKARTIKKKGKKRKQTAVEPIVEPVGAATAVEPVSATTAQNNNSNGAGGATETDLVDAFLVHNISCKDRGTRRLLPEDILELQVGDEIAVVIPMDHTDDSEFVKATRLNVKKRIKSEIIDCSRSDFAGLSSEDIEEKFAKLLQEKHTVRREGKWYCEFPAAVTCFAQRDDFHTWSNSTMDLALDQGAGVGLAFHGCEGTNQRSMSFELRLDELLSVEVWKKREDKDSFNHHIKFSEKVKDLDTLGAQLVQHISFVSGDVTSTYEALYKYYRAKSDTLNTKLNAESKKSKKVTATAEISRVEDAKELLENEIDGEVLQSFLAMADQTWYHAITDHYKKIHSVSDELIHEDEYIRLFDEMESLFPLHAQAQLDLSINDLFWEPYRFNENTLRERKKTALAHFFALTRARNKSNMIHWAMIETLAVFGKGISQVTTRSTAGKGFCCKLQFALLKVDEIYEKCQPDIKQMLRREATISFVLDNYQKVIAKRTQTNNKSAITHRATASSVMRHKVPSPALGSIVTSPSGVRYSVRAVKRETPYLVVVTLCFESLGPVAEDEVIFIYDDINHLRERFMWPNTNLKWIMSPAGLDNSRPPLTYTDQRVPAMARFKVPHGATDDELLFLKQSEWPRNFKTFLDPKRYQKLIHRKERISQMATYCEFLRKQDSVAEVLNHNNKNNANAERHDYDRPHLFDGREFDVKAAMLADAFKMNSKIINNATNIFQREMIKLGNPLAGTPDEFYFFPLNDCDETTKDGALRAIIKANVNMNILHEVSDSRYQHIGEGRTADVYGDQLTELRLKDCRQYVMKSLTKIGHEDYVDQLLKALESNFIEHDYLHETFHQMQAIYGQYWGGFLQPLVCLMGRKRVSGDPMGGGKIIDHHNFLLDVYRAALRHRCKKFVEKLAQSDLFIDENATDAEARDMFLSIESMYEVYCEELEQSHNEKSRLVALFIKKVGSYLRCKTAIRKKRHPLDRNRNQRLARYVESDRKDIVPRRWAKKNREAIQEINPSVARDSQSE